jgi:hypothetical protein
MCYMRSPSNSSLFDHLNHIGRGVQIIKLLDRLFNSSLLGLNILLCTLFSNTLKQTNFTVSHEFQFTMYNGPTNALLYNKTLI